MKTATRIMGLVAGVALALALTGCGTQSNSEADTASVAGLGEPGVFRVLISYSAYPPMSEQVNGVMVGFEPDQASAVAKLWGVDMRQVQVKFDGLLPALGAGRADAVWSSLYLSDERLQAADAVTYMKTGPELVVTVANPKGIESAEDLSGKSVSVQSASINEGVLKDLSKQLEADGKPPIVLQSYPDVPQTVAAVQNGKADALLETDVGAANIVSRSKTPLKLVPGAFPPSTKFAIYVPKGSKLADELRNALRQLHENGTLDELATKWGLDPQKISIE